MSNTTKRKNKKEIKLGEVSGHPYLMRERVGLRQTIRLKNRQLEIIDQSLVKLPSTPSLQDPSQVCQEVQALIEVKVELMHPHNELVSTPWWLSSNNKNSNLRLNLTRVPWMAHELMHPLNVLENTLWWPSSSRLAQMRPPRRKDWVNLLKWPYRILINLSLETRSMIFLTSMHETRLVNA